MFPSRWFGPGQKRSWAFRPAVSLLEDRTTPSILSPIRPWLPLPTPGPATHLAVIAPIKVQSGQTFNVLVVAQDGSNLPALSYSGTVHFSLGTPDEGATLPLDYTFTSGDHGFHRFQISLGATGSQTIQVTDIADKWIGGGATTTVNPAVAATQLLVLTPENVSAGVPTTATVIALDAAGHRVPNYTGTVHFTSSDPQATLPADYTFNPRDRGRHTFMVTFPNTGAQTLMATDLATNSISGLATVTVEPVRAVTHFGVFSLGPTLAGFATPVVVVALDASNHVVPGYTGTVHFGSSDSQSILPADYTFSVSDNGACLFSVTFATSGQQTLTVTDTVNPTSTGSFNFRVFSRLMRRTPPLEEWARLL